MAFNIFGKLSMDGSGFEAGTKKAGVAVQKMGRKMKQATASANHAAGQAAAGMVKKVSTAANSMRAKLGAAFRGAGAQLAGALAVGALAAKARETADWAAKVRDFGNTFGVSTEAIQKMEFAATQSGIELGTVMDAMKDLGKNTSEALMGASNKVWAFETLGLSIDKIKGAKLEDVFAMVARQIKDIGPVLTADQTKAIEELMGGAGFQSLNMMRNDLDAMMQQAEELGVVVEDATIQKLGAASDKMAELASRAKPALADIATGFLYAGESAVNAFHSALNSFEDLAESYYRWKGDIGGAAGSGERDGDAENAAATQQSNEQLAGEFATQSQQEAMAEDANQDTDPSEEREHQHAMAEAARKRAEEAKRLARLQDEARKREMERLPVAQKIAAIQKQIAEEQKRQAELAAQQTRSGSAGADKARREIAAGKEQMAQATAAHGDVSEIARVAAAIEDLKQREKALAEARKGKEFSGTGRAGLAEYSAKLEGAKQRVGELMASGPKGMDFGHLKDLQGTADKLRKEAAAAEKAGDKDKAARLRADAHSRMESALDFGVEQGMDEGQVRDFLRAMQAVRDAQTQYNQELAVSKKDQKGYMAADNQMAAEQVENARQLAEEQARLNALREQYGDDAVRDAMAAQQRIAAAEGGLEETFAKLRQQHAKAISDIKQLEGGHHSEFQVNTNQLTEARDKKRAEINDALEMVQGAERSGIIQDEDGRYGVTDSGGNFKWLSDTLEGAQWMLDRLPASIEEDKKKLQAIEDKYARAEARRLELLAAARERATQSGQKIQTMTQGNQAAQIEALESRKRQEALQAEQQKLVAQQEKERQAKRGQKMAATPDAAAFKADQLARIGGALGGRNPVLDLAKRSYMMQQEQRDIARSQAYSLRTISGV